jgi:hypothetical protein
MVKNTTKLLKKHKKIYILFEFLNNNQEIIIIYN